jgi:hypothetical protein
MLAGDQLQDKSRQWLSPADPSSNYNLARKTYHDGSATWFIQGTTLREWEVTGSLLWIHGKRMFSHVFSSSRIVSVLCSGLRQKHPLVRIALTLLVSVHRHMN